MNLLQLGQTEEASAVVAGCTLEREQWTTEFWMVTAPIRMKQYETTPSDAAAQSVLVPQNVLEVDLKTAYTRPRRQPKPTVSWEITTLKKNAGKGPASWRRRTVND